MNTRPEPKKAWAHSLHYCNQAYFGENEVGMLLIAFAAEGLCNIWVKHTDRGITAWNNTSMT